MRTNKVIFSAISTSVGYDMYTDIKKQSKQNVTLLFKVKSQGNRSKGVKFYLCVLRQNPKSYAAAHGEQNATLTLKYQSYCHNPKQMSFRYEPTSVEIIKGRTTVA